MKSNRADLLALLAGLLAVLGIMRARPTLAARFHDLAVKADTYTLPSPEQTYVASLGYRSAVADLVFGHVLVAYGLHFQEKRRFEYVGEYLDTITRLDPKFRDPYRFADTLLTLQPVAPPPEFYRKARQLQERGLEELPYDQELWSTAGQFLAYLAPSYLPDAEEKLEYQRTGTRYLMRACELIGSNDSIPYHCITAANLLSKQGNPQGMRKFLELLASVSDDATIQNLATGYLRKSLGDAVAQMVKQRAEAFNDAWKSDLGFSPRPEIASLAPRFDAAACAGPGHFGKPGCISSWAAWAAQREATEAP